MAFVNIYMQDQPYKLYHTLRKHLLLEQPSGGVPGKKYSENMQQIYKRTPMPKCDFNKVAR